MTLDTSHSGKLAPTGSGLEAQWRRHLLQLTDLSIQLYDDGAGDDPALQASIEQVRREMSAVEDALARLAGSSFAIGRSEPVSGRPPGS